MSIDVLRTWVFPALIHSGPRPTRPLNRITARTEQSSSSSSQRVYARANGAGIIE
jgi:hypothetical protein